MTILLEDWLGDYDNVLVVHADLGEIEWDGNIEHIEKYKPEAWPLEAVRAKKTFFDMVERRFETRPEVPSWPSPSFRACTSDLKRGPIDKLVRHTVKDRDNKKVVHCIGIRAEESPARAKKKILDFNKRESKAGREVWTWFPIFELKTAEVFKVIEDAGHEPHWAYKAGMSRLSCSFCILANKDDLKTAAKLRPNLYKKYVEMEKRTGYTMNMSGIPLEEITGRKVIPIAVAT